MGDTTIEWTDFTWNPTTGCTKVSPGCKNCYAERVFPRPYPGRAFTDVRMHRERLSVPMRMKKPKRIFVDSMSDMFHADVESDFIYLVFEVMRACPQHTFQILTKRADRMQRMMSSLEAVKQFQPGGPWPLPNVWLGVSIENQETCDERLPLLLQTPAAKRFISYEPALGPVDFTGVPCPIDFKNQRSTCNFADIDLLIAGGESGHKARPPHPQWFYDALDQCERCGVPFMFKQWGEYSPRARIDTPPSDTWVSAAGEYMKIGHDGVIRFPAGDWQAMYKVGKKAAGRMLYGKIYDGVAVQ